MRKIFNYLLLSIIVFITVNSCSENLTVDDIQNTIIETERERLPLTLQKSQGLSTVKSITVDSIKIMVKSEPMSGFLYTTWEYTPIFSRKTIKKSIIIEVVDICNSEVHEGYIEWKSLWGDAYRSVVW